MFPVGGGNDGLDAVRSVMAALWLVQARSVWLRLAKAQELPIVTIMETATSDIDMGVAASIGVDALRPTS